MKAMMRKLFSFSATETDNFKDKQLKIELVSCPLKEMMCKFHLSSIDKSYHESEQYRKDGDFEKSINTLKGAFIKTNELMDRPCTKCAQFYRTNIIESLENIHEELESIATGIFGNKKYQSVYINANSVLKEFENVGKSKKFQLNESKERFLGNYLN
jgi:hypothetical protein